MSGSDTLRRASGDRPATDAADTGRPDVVTVNAGAVTIKLTRHDHHDDAVALAQRDPWDGEDVEPFAEIDEGRSDGDEMIVVHRVVHGGDEFTEPTVVDDDVVDRIEALGALAPLHHPRIVAALRLARDRWPSSCHVAVFDTAFHRTIGPAQSTYPIPREWTSQWGLRRYGFHGLSHAAVADRAPTIARRAPDEPTRLVSCHVGSGVSVTAIRAGRSVDTTMGFTPLEGPAMTTRSGSIDPGLLLWLLRTGRVDAEELEDTLRRGSGLAGMTGTSGDLREVVVAASGRTRDADDARLALDVYVHGLAQAIASMAASAGGLDVLAFTGGVVENLPELRERIVRQLHHLGAVVDQQRNRRAIACDAVVSASGASADVVLVANGEHRTMLRAARSLDGHLPAGSHMEGRSEDGTGVRSLVGSSGVRR